jgi:O-acetyl-ADP-ribose deacetylase (regulator of RNase III)
MKNTKITLYQGDITSIECNAIVNAANTGLLGGGGVDGAIHSAGGRQISDECAEIRKRQGGCKVGEAVLTNAGNLNCDKIIHTVGPIWHGGTVGEEELLGSCYRNSLFLAKENNLKKIAFPNISTGVYGFPKEKAVKIALKTVKDFIEGNHDFEEIIFVCYDIENYELYLEELKD